MTNLTVNPTILKTVPLFALLSDNQLGSLFPAIQHRTYPRHSFMLRAGERPDALYIILAGRAEIEQPCDQRAIGSWYAHERRERRRVRGADEMGRIAHVERAVLHVENDEIEARRGDDLHDHGTCAENDDASGDRARSDALTDAVHPGGY